MAASVLHSAIDTAPSASFATTKVRREATMGQLMEVTIGDLLRAAADECADRTALVSGTVDPADRRRWSYARLLGDAERAARALLARFDPGEHVALWAPNLPEWEILQFGAALAGIVVVTVNPSLLEDEARYVLDQSRAAAVLHVA